MGNEDHSMGNEDLFDGERGSFDGERGGTSLRRYQIRGLEYSVFCAIGMAFPLVYVSQQNIAETKLSMIRGIKKG